MQESMKLNIKNANKEFLTMIDELPFTLIKHSPHRNIHVESDSPPVQFIPLLKYFFQSLFPTDKRSTREREKANESIAESIAKLIDTYSLFFMVGPVNNTDYSKAFSQSKSNF